jgi:SAM-dependent methyltransferase
MHRGYDALDALVQGIIWAEPAPDIVQPRHADMIPYEPTPARVVLDLVDQVPLSAHDVFYDLGAGLGHVAILAHLITGAMATGVEIEAAYCLYAQHRAAALGLSHLRFVNLDARDASYADGTVFFMYTPFTGELLAAVLDVLAREARRRSMIVCTYGACTFEVLG